MPPTTGRSGFITAPLNAGADSDTSGGEWLLRFVTGYWLDGARRTDATFLHRATEKHVRGRVGRWSWMPGWKRALIRLGCTLTTLLLCAAALYAPRATGTALYWLVVAMVPVAVFCSIRSLDKRRLKHKRDYHKGVAHWYAAEFGLPLHQINHLISIPAGHRKDATKVVTIRLPYHFARTGIEQEKLAERLAHKLGLVDPEWYFTMTGRPTLTMSLVPKPPSSVTYGDFSRHAKQNAAT